MGLKPRLPRLWLPSKVTVAVVPVAKTGPKTAVPWPAPGTPPLQLLDVLHVPEPLVFHVPPLDAEITRSTVLPTVVRLKVSPATEAGVAPIVKAVLAGTLTQR